MLEVGSLLDGKYKILNEIGHGGMSVVYLALNERANKTWAVKEVRKDGGNDSSVVSQNLVAETEMLKKLDHPNLPSIIDVIDKDDSFIIVMDYIEGNSLQHLLDNHGRQNPDKVVEWAKQLCDVLGYLHSRKPPIIYRDMKPANVMLRPNGDVSLIDFGTAREYKITSTGDTTWLGTRGYAAPEQFGKMGQTDGRTDIYNLGATMFHLVTGIAPVGQDTLVHPIGEIIPQYAGSGLEEVILKCCKYYPDERYQSCAELMYALEHVNEGNKKARRARKFKLIGFAACLLISLIALGAGFGFRTAYASTQGQAYKRNIAEAEAETDFFNKIAYYQAAMRLDPGNPEAYENLINDVELEPEFNKNVYNSVKSCIGSRDADPANRKTAIDFLRERDPETYADFNFRFGSLAYLGAYASGKIIAADYLKYAIESGGLKNNKLAAATMMYELAEAYQKKQKGENRSWKTAMEIGGGYDEYWSTLEKLASDLDTLQAETGKVAYPIRVCDEVATELDQHAVNFTDALVSEERLRNTLSKVETFMKRMTKNAENLTRPEKEEIDRVNINVARAAKRLDSLESGVSEGTAPAGNGASADIDYTTGQ